MVVGTGATFLVFSFSFSSFVTDLNMQSHRHLASPRFRARHDRVEEIKGSYDKTPA